MKKIGLIVLIMLASLSAAFAQKKDRTDAYMYNKQGQYYQAMQSIEKCINHPDFYHMKTKDQAQAWLYRAAIYVNASALDNAASICPNALAIAAESIQKLKQTDQEFANENSDFVQSVEEYIASITSSNAARNGANSYSGSQSQNLQWEFYNSISNYKSIKVDIPDRNVIRSWWWSNGIEQQSGQISNNDYYIGMIIKGDYTVNLVYSHPWKAHSYANDDNFHIFGTGRLVWENQRMVLRMDVKKESRDSYYMFNSGVLRKIYSMNQTSTFVYNVEYAVSRQGFYFEGNDIVAQRKLYSEDARGNSSLVETQTDKIVLSGFHSIDIEAKTQSELNAQNSDMYGKWQWNDDRSEIFLESTTKDAYLVMWNNDGNLDWGFQMDNAASGYKTETAENGAELAYLMLTFDGGAEQSFTFEKSITVSGASNFQYVQYDRFMGTMKRDASILGQIKDKRIMIVNYKQNGSDKTAMFQLEGLEAIYNAITQ